MGLGGDEVVGLGLWFWWLGIVVAAWLMVFFFFFLWWWWLAVGMAITGVAWTEKKMVERERHNGKIKIILFK